MDGSQERLTKDWDSVTAVLRHGSLRRKIQFKAAVALVKFQG